MSDQTALSLRYYNAGSRIRWQGVLWHVDSLKVAPLSVRSAAPALLWTVTAPVRLSWFISHCSYDRTAPFSTLTTETAGWLASLSIYLPNYIWPCPRRQ